MSEELPTVTIYTDGACRGNPGPGAWAAVLISGSNKQKEIKGVKALTTNNEMELTAVIMGLRELKRSCRVKLYSDSAYIVNAFNQGWIDNWLRNNWRTKNKTEVKNRELWEELIELTDKHSVEFVKVKGHAGNHFNEQVDELANQALDEANF